MRLNQLHEAMLSADREWLQKNLDALLKKKSSIPPGTDTSIIDRYIANHKKALASIVD